MLTRGDARQTPELDLSNCEREAIRIPGSIQPHGVLLVLDPEKLRIERVSNNTVETLGLDVEWLLGRSLHEVWSAPSSRTLFQRIDKAPLQSHPLFLDTVTFPVRGTERTWDALAHRTPQSLILELEAVDGADDSLLKATDLHREFDDFSLRAEAVKDVPELCHEMAVTVRQMTGFDRVLIYQFDDDWNGMVVGEDGNGRLPSYLRHRFPASDIPAQARELYRLNRVRIIPDANYQPVPILPAIGPGQEPLDLSFSTLRSVSPIHVEYMRNMETMSSMSISILRNGKLWGLISCHHREPRMVPVTMRTTCDLIARAFALRLTSLEQTQLFERRMEVRSTYSKLLSEMAENGDYAAALVEHSAEMLKFVAAEGAAILSQGQCQLIGRTPAESGVRQLAEWLFKTIKQDVFVTDSLNSQWDQATRYTDHVAGLLAVSVSRLHPSYLMWFRPEVVQTIQWGGDPHKSVTTNGEPLRLHPRKSFETWKETVSDMSAPWDESEVEAAVELRNAIVGIVLRNAEELAEVNAELTRSNKELEAFSYSVSHDLRAPLRHIVGYAEMLRSSGGSRLSQEDERCISVIIESSEYAGKLVDKLLGYSRLGRAELQLSRVNLQVLVAELEEDVMRDAVGRRIEWTVGELPVVDVDLIMLRMALRDLMANAVKYTRERAVASITIDSRDEGNEWVISVRDNGVGFDMQYVDKLFGVFQRLHRWEDYEGTGIGLANVRRVIERHGGRTWAEGREGAGATFSFTLPKSQKTAERESC